MKYAYAVVRISRTSNLSRPYGGCYICAMISIYTYGGNACLELPKNVRETQLCLLTTSVASETILINVNDVGKSFLASAENNAWGRPTLPSHERKMLGINKSLTFGHMLSWDKRRKKKNAYLLL